MYLLLFILIIGNEAVNVGNSGMAFNTYEECRSEGNAAISKYNPPQGRKAVFRCELVDQKKFI